MSPLMPPEVTWSSSQTSDEKSMLLEPERMLHWRPEETDHSPWLKLDFRQERELGGLVIDWGTRWPSRSFVVEKSALGLNWEPVGQVNRNEGNYAEEGR